MARPKMKFDEKDLQAVETFGKIKAPYELMAEHFGCTKQTIVNKMSEQEGEFFYHYKKGFSGTRAALAKKQIEVAMDGHVTMLIWLGKQYLEQSDKTEVMGSGGGPLEVVEIVHNITKKDKK